MPLKATQSKASVKQRMEVGSTAALSFVWCRARYINTVKYLVDLGFYVNLDFHSIDPDSSIHNFEVGGASCLSSGSLSCQRRS